MLESLACNQGCTGLLDLLVLRLDSLAIDEDTLALIWLWLSPFSDIRRKLHDDFLLRPFEE